MLKKCSLTPVGQDALSSDFSCFSNAMTSGCWFIVPDAGSLVEDALLLS